MEEMSGKIRGRTEMATVSEAKCNKLWKIYTKKKKYLAKKMDFLK